MSSISIYTGTHTVYSIGHVVSIVIDDIDENYPGNSGTQITERTVEDILCNKNWRN